MRMREKLILRVASRILVPFILLFALYVQFHGDFGPGGGFQAGVIFAAGFILYALIFGIEALRRLAPPPIMERLMAVGVLIYGGTGVLMVVLGGNFLDYDMLGKHGQEHGIFLVELGVGLAVASTMTSLFYRFADYMAAMEDSGEDDGGSPPEDEP